ncbi:MAG: chorismate mutase [Mucilaginibacter sp.]
MMLCLGSVTYASAQTKTQAEINADLGVYRKQIDSLDKLLIQVLGNRQRVVKDVGIYKKNNNIPPLQPARFKQVLDRAIASGQKENLSVEFITDMMNAIHKESLRIEGDSTAVH